MSNFTLQFEVDIQKKHVFPSELYCAETYKTFIETKADEISKHLLKAIELSGETQPLSRLKITYERDFEKQIKAFKIEIFDVPQNFTEDLLTDYTMAKLLSDGGGALRLSDHIKLQKVSRSDMTRSHQTGFLLFNAAETLPPLPPSVSAAAAQKLTITAEITKDAFGTTETSTYTFGYQP